MPSGRSVRAVTERSHLHLDCRDRMTRLEIDGRSLLCLAEGAVLARHPLHRLHRVSLRGNVSVHAEALAALSSAGVPLAVLAGDGRTLALVPPRWQRRTSLESELARLSPPQVGQIVEDWRLAEISRHARALRLDDPAGAARSGWHAPELLLRASQPNLSANAARRLVNEAGSFCRLLSLRVLTDAGIVPRWLGSGGPTDPDIGHAFAQIVFWRLLRFAVLRRPRRDVSRAIDPRDPIWGRDLAALAERARPGLSAALARDLHCFHLHLIDLRSDAGWRG